MLSSLLTSLQTASTSSIESVEMPLNASVQEGVASAQSGFLSIFEQLNGKPLATGNQKYLSAWLSIMPEKIGETLPQSLAISESSADEPLPETLTGDSLLAYLMANSGDSINAFALQLADSDVQQELMLNKLEEQEATFNASGLEGIADEGDDSVDEVAEINFDVEPMINKVIESDEIKFTVSEADLPVGTSQDSSDPVIITKNEDADLLVSVIEPELARLSGEVEINESVDEDDQAEDTVDSDELNDAGSSLFLKDEVLNGAVNEASDVLPVENEDSKLIAAEGIVAIKTDTPSKTGNTPNTDSLKESDNSDSLLKNVEQKLSTPTSVNDAPVVDNSKKVGTETQPIMTGLAQATTDNKSLGLTADRVQQKELEQIGRVASQDDIGDLDIGDSDRHVLDHASLLKSTSAKAGVETVIAQPMDSAEKSIKLALAANALAEKIQTMVKGDLKHAFIRLDPPELGALEIRVQVHHDQTQIQIVSSSGQVREALESQSAKLREALAEQGLNMANLDVSDQQNRQQSQGNESGSSGSGAEAGQPLDTSEISANIKINLGLVDQYV